MKLDPIKNPHSKVGQVQKKTKQEEKDELIEKTKIMARENYGVSLPSLFLSRFQLNTHNPLEEVCEQEVHADNCRYERLRLECRLICLLSF